MNLPDDLLKLIRHGENYQIEYKEAKNELPKSIYETVSSFSNREGGDIFLGVNDCGVGYADELGSGMRNSYKFTRLYSGANPEFIEGNIFKTIIPLSISAKTIVSGQASGQADTQVSTQAGTQDSGQVDGQPLTISLDVTRLNQLLDYCSTPRTREEMQQFCGIKSRDYFRTKILVPLISLKKIFPLILDKPNSPKQKYCSNKNYSSLENSND